MDEVQATLVHKRAVMVIMTTGIAKDVLEVSGSLAKSSS
jgi:hypothetical protein